MIHQGFKPPEKIETKKEGVKHVLGSSVLPGRVIEGLGDWRKYVTELDVQSRDGVETFACTVFNSLKRLELLVYKKTGLKVNYSDRYIANIAVMKGILDPKAGADVHQILELIRTTTGLLSEDRLPWDNNYYTVEQSLLAELLLEGPAWYKDWTFMHGWLWVSNLSPTEKRRIIEDALTKGTVGVSVYAWVKNGAGLYYKPEGVRDGHWTGIDAAPRGEPYYCGDSYEPTAKELDPLFDFGFGKIFYLEHTFNKSLRYGMKDREVTFLQASLRELGYDIPHAVTDYYGIETKEAVRKFQQDHNIQDDGTHFGPRTRYALNTELLPVPQNFINYLLSLVKGLFEEG